MYKGIILLVIQNLSYYLKQLTTNFSEYSFCCHFIFTCYSHAFFIYCTVFAIILLEDELILIIFTTITNFVVSSLLHFFLCCQYY